MRAVDKAYATVRDGILSGRYPGGSRVTEQDVAAAAGVSRTPVREALRRLHAEGLVDFTANLGAVVTVWNDTDADEIFELRAMLESYGARRAACSATPEQLARLRRLAEEQHRECRERGPGFLERVGSINQHFHRELQEAAGSPRLSRALAALIEAPLMMKTFEKYTPDDLERSAAHHLELCSALEARDAEWADAVMRAHVHAARGAMKR